METLDLLEAKIKKSRFLKLTLSPTTYSIITIDPIRGVEG
jgi:hypothetical protein